MDNQYNNQQPQYDPNQYNQQPQFQEPVPPYGQPQPDQYMQPQYDTNQYVQQQYAQQPQYDPQQYAQQPQFDPQQQYAQQPQQQQYVQQQYVQPQYAQPPMQQPQQYTRQPMQQPQQYTRQPMQQAPDDGGRNSHAANVMCVISLICMYVIPFVSLLGTGLLGELITHDSKLSEVTSMAVSFVSLLVSASGLASWVLMIIVRVKYPKNIFGKVLMWLYITMLVLGVVALIFVMISCLNSLRRCS